jgi:hypothetical protein
VAAAAVAAVGVEEGHVCWVHQYSHDATPGIRHSVAADSDETEEAVVVLPEAAERRWDSDHPGAGENEDGDESESAARPRELAVARRRVPAEMEVDQPQAAAAAEVAVDLQLGGEQEQEVRLCAMQSLEAS